MPTFAAVSAASGPASPPPMTLIRLILSFYWGELRSAIDNHFVDIVLGEIEFAALEGGEELLDLPVGEHLTHCKPLRLLHLDGIAFGDVVAVEDGVRAGGLDMKEGKDAPPRLEAGVQPVDHRYEQRLGKIIESGP